MFSTTTTTTTTLFLLYITFASTVGLDGHDGAFVRAKRQSSRGRNTEVGLGCFLPGLKDLLCVGPRVEVGRRPGSNSRRGTNSRRGRYIGGRNGIRSPIGNIGSRGGANLRRTGIDIEGEDEVLNFFKRRRGVTLEGKNKRGNLGFSGGDRSNILNLFNVGERTDVEVNPRTGGSTFRKRNEVFPGIGTEEKGEFDISRLRFGSSKKSCFFGFCVDEGRGLSGR